MENAIWLEFAFSYNFCAYTQSNIWGKGLSVLVFYSWYKLAHLFIYQMYAVVKGMLRSYKGNLGGGVVLCFSFFSYCELAIVSGCEGDNATCDRLRKWSLLVKYLFFQRILDLEIKWCLMPKRQYSLIVEGLILTALSLQGPSFLPGGPLSPEGILWVGWGPSWYKYVTGLFRLENVISHPANRLQIRLPLYGLGRDRCACLISVHTVAELNFGSNSDHQCQGDWDWKKCNKLEQVCSLDFAEQ